MGSMIESDSNKLLGTTQKGGKNNDGTIYSFNYITNQLQVLYEFDSLTEGSSSRGQLLEASNGNLFGINYQGGIHGGGTLYEYNSNLDTLYIRHNFSNWERQEIVGMIELDSGNIVGYSFTNYMGNIFQYNIHSHSYIVKKVFDAVSGYFPSGKPLVHTNGDLYGTAIVNQPAAGSIFAYNIGNNTFPRTFPFLQRSNGIFPTGGVSQCKNAIIDSILVPVDSIFCGNFVDIRLGHKSKLNNSATWSLYVDSLNSSPFIQNKTGNFKLRITKEQTIYITSEGGCPLTHPIRSRVVFVKSPTEFFDTLDICGGDSVHLPDGNVLLNINTDTSYLSTLSSTLGCDSMINTFIRVTNLDTSITNAKYQLISNDTSANYQWLNCDSNFIIIPGQTMQTYIPLKDGNYAVQLAKRSCVDTSSCNSVIGIGLKEYSFGKLVKITPNPIVEKFTIDLGRLNQAVDVHIYNSNGKIISRQSFRNVQNIESSINLSKGIYLIQVIVNSEEVVNLKVIKE